MPNINNHASRFRKGLSNPFEAGGRDWCPTCQQDVDTQMEHAHRGAIYVYRRRCRRCGSVLARGIHDQVPTISGSPEPERESADSWTKERGEDRR